MNSKKYFLIFNVIFFFLSFTGSVYQSFYIYDPFHWGLAQSSLELFSSSKPYKDFFIHYGFLYTLTNSIILELTNQNLISTMYLSAFFFSIANFLLCYIAFENFKIKASYFLPILIFLAHPFANHPWYNYQFYFLITVSIYFFLNEKKYNLFFTGLFISLSCLVYENFIYLGFILVSIIFYLKNKTIKSYLIFLGFLIPQLIFHTYLLIYNLHDYWLKTFWLNEIFLKIYNLTFFELVIRYFEIFLSKSLFSFVVQPYYLLFLLIFVLNFYNFLNFIFVKKKLYTTEKNNIYFFVLSLICLFTYASTLHKLNIFRFSTGPIIGILFLVYFIEQKFPQDKNYILILIVLLLGSASLVPLKQENNRFFPLFEDVKNNYNSTQIKFFRHQKWRNETWNVINAIENQSKSIAKTCKEITRFINYTEDAFIYIIAKQYLDSDQYLFWYQNKKYHKLLSEHFNIEMDELVNNVNKFENGIIFFNLKDLNSFKEKINFNKFSFVEFTYSYQQKRKGIIVPNSCLKKIL